jgi:hypothetical protein
LDQRAAELAHRASHGLWETRLDAKVSAATTARIQLEKDFRGQMENTRKLAEAAAKAQAKTMGGDPQGALDDLCQTTRLPKSILNTESTFLCFSRPNTPNTALTMQ